MRVGVVDYGAGNLGSVLNALALLGEEPVVLREGEEVLRVDRIILPGVGAAGEAMTRLRERGLDVALDEAVWGMGKPMLGICLGMQLLAERLLEFGEHRGLGWIAGEVVDIRSCDGASQLRVPHMGWNAIEVTPVGASVFDQARGAREFYFAHSFTLRTTDQSVVAAYTSYGIDLVSAIRKDTVFATQFHPEKSQVSGERLLAAFMQWNP